MTITCLHTIASGIAGGQMGQVCIEIQFYLITWRKRPIRRLECRWCDNIKTY